MEQQLIDELKQGINKVEPFSDSVQMVFRKMNERPINIDEICGLLELDPLLTTSILRLANSPFYGFVRKIDSIHDATVLLGIHSLRQVIISYSMVNAFPEAPGGALNRNALWKHSIGVAVAARLLSRCCGQESEEVFVAGMLHDIGQFLMDQCLQDQYQQVFEFKRQNCCTLREAEQQVLGLGHSKVGAVAIRHWKLPDYLAEVALRHEEPPAGDELNSLVDLVHVANVLVKGLWISPENDDLMTELSVHSLRRLGLEMAQIEELLPEIGKMCREVIGRMLQ